MLKRWIAGLLALVLLLQAVACGHGEPEKADPENGIYAVYYRGNKYNTVTEFIEVDTTVPEEIALTLMQAMKEPAEDVDGLSFFLEGMEVPGVSWEGTTMKLTFSSAYSNMTATQEVMCRSALVQMLTQIPEVQYVTIYVGSQPLMGANGKPIGSMSTADFVNVTGKDINKIQHVILTLYFADPTGRKLVGEELEIAYSSTISVEEFLLEQLIAGPESGDGEKIAVLPSAAQVLGVSIRDGICYVNFSKASMAEPMASVDAYAAIYAIVNSLTSLSGVSQVQIMLDGSSDQVWNGVSLNSPFFYNADYVQAEEKIE